MKPILPTSYFGPIEEYIILGNHDEVCYEVNEHFVKKSYRNRCHILGANGIQKLTVPIVLKGRERTAIKDIKIVALKAYFKAF